MDGQIMPIEYKQLRNHQKYKDKMGNIHLFPIFYHKYVNINNKIQ